MLNLLIRIKPHNSTLGQPLRMAAHALDWGDSLNQRRWGGKRLTTVMMFVVCGEVVSVLDGIPSYSCRTSTKPTVQEIFVPA
jgi:hypothetical protein